MSIELLKFFPKWGSRTTKLVHAALYAALIGSPKLVNRFKATFEELQDKDTSRFYHKLMISKPALHDVFEICQTYGDRQE